jgi:hypothetical protein
VRTGLRPTVASVCKDVRVEARNHACLDSRQGPLLESTTRRRRQRVFERYRAIPRCQGEILRTFWLRLHRAEYTR